MYKSNVTKDYDNIFDYDNITSTNCTNNDNKIEITLLLFTIIPCGMSLICLISFMVYTLVKPLINKKQKQFKKSSFYKWRRFCTQIIQLDVS